MNVPTLSLRANQDTPLTAVQHDSNWKTIRDFCNALASRISAVLKPNGSLKDGAVDDPAILADRVVTAPKLHYTANLFAVATGANAYSATLAPGADFTRGDGIASALVLYVKFPATNTLIGAAVTLNVNTSGAARIVKNGAVDLEAGEIVGGRIYQVVWDGTNYQMIGGAKESLVETSKVTKSGPLSFAGNQNPVDWGEDADVMSYTHGITSPDAVFGLIKYTGADPAFGWTNGDMVSPTNFAWNPGSAGSGWDATDTPAISFGFNALKSWVKVVPYNVSNPIYVLCKKGAWASIAAEDLADWKIHLTTVKF